MTRYSLDTNICIAYLTGDTSIAAFLPLLDPQAIVVCSVARAELYFGARKSARVERNLKGISAFLAPLQSADFDEESAFEYGIIRAELEQRGTPIGPNDLLIAAIARRNDHVLVTRNDREFLRVRGLRVETWSDPIR